VIIYNKISNVEYVAFYVSRDMSYK